MPQYKRAVVPGGTFFFTVVTFNRRPLFSSDLARHCLHNVWKDAQARYPFKVEAICLLPDHLHCIWTLPKNDFDFSSRWNMIKGLFSKRYLAKGGKDGSRNNSRKRKGEAAIWQRRFWEHVIRNSDDLQKHFDYTHFNPVKHGYVKQAADWPWSSLHRLIQMGWYGSHWGMEEPDTIKGFDCVGE